MFTLRSLFFSLISSFFFGIGFFSILAALDFSSPASFTLAKGRFVSQSAHFYTYCFTKHILSVHIQNNQLHSLLYADSVLNNRTDKFKASKAKLTKSLAKHYNLELKLAIIHSRVYILTPTLI